MQSDIIVIGAGIAGSYAAAALAEHATVTLLEREAQPGYHATGRSAATWAPDYGPAEIQQLTALSHRVLCKPPLELGGYSFADTLGEMLLCTASDTHYRDQQLAAGMLRISMHDAIKRVPLLRTDVVTDVLYNHTILRLDVDALHQATLKHLRSHGGTLLCNANVESLSFNDNQWQVQTTDNSFTAPIVINAAGAWADYIATKAGTKPAGLQAKRRSAAIVPYAKNSNMPNWPMVFGANESFYCSPFGSGLLISPADETTVEPHDVWPEEIDIATGIDRFQQLIQYDVATVTHRWAGLRTFVPDGLPVVGFDPVQAGFFWLAGQGGYGIQTSPAISALCQQLIQPGLTSAVCEQIEDNGAFDELAVRLSPRRFH